MTEKDMGTGPEVFFVVGTALKVPGARSLVTELCRAAKARGGSLYRPIERHYNLV